MAGHSHWANIQHKKGAVDKRRGALFGKLSRAIIVAARNGGADTDTNLALRYAIDKAKAASMSKDTIERAVKKGSGELGGDDYEEIVYEGYGPGGVAVLCNILTDNRNRTAGDIRKVFEIHGGNMGNSGCVSWMFERKGLFVLSASQTSEEALFELALEAGADDVSQSGETFEVTCPPGSFHDVKAALEGSGLALEVAEYAQIASNKVRLDAAASRRVLKLMDALDENEDVQSVTANFEIPDEVMAEVTGD